jgi:ribosomal subunit interface protein
MDKSLQPSHQVDLDNVGPEIKSYIYQSLTEFEPYTTPSTVVSVIAKNPLKLLKGGETDHLPEKEKLKTMYRISISLAEDGTKVEAEGLHEDIYAAIKIAKDAVLKQLEDMYDKVISAKERQMQIHTAINSGNSNVH